MSSSTTTPKVSVIVPMYNCEHYVGACLASLRAQSLSDFQVICVDDGSTDNTLEKARSATSGDDRFTLIALPENKGQSVARNTALDEATGQYLVFLDSDDSLVPDALDKLYACASEHDLEELYFSARVQYESYEVHQLVQENYRNRTSFDQVVTGKELFSFFQEHDEFFPQTAFRMVKRSVVEENKVRFFEGIIHEDLLFTFQVMVLSKRSSFLNEELYLRLVRAGSTMTTPKRTLRNIKGHLVCISEMKRWLHEHAETIDERFMDAATKCVATFSGITGKDWVEDISDGDKEAFLRTMDPHEKLVFYEDIIQRGIADHELEQRYLTSTTFRVGNAVLAIPKWLKERLNFLRGRTKSEHT